MLMSNDDEEIFEGEWINEFERQSLDRRNPSVLETQLVKNVLAARDSPCINPLTYYPRGPIKATLKVSGLMQGLSLTAGTFLTS